LKLQPRKALVKWAVSEGKKGGEEYFRNKGARNNRESAAAELGEGAGEGAAEKVYATGRRTKKKHPSKKKKKKPQKKMVHGNYKKRSRGKYWTHWCARMGLHPSGRSRTKGRVKKGKVHGKSERMH